MQAATVMQDLDAAREVLSKTKLWDGTILAEFQRLSKDKVTFRHTQNTTSKARYLLFFVTVLVISCVLYCRDCSLGHLEQTTIRNRE